MPANQIKIAQLQTKVSADKDENLRRIAALLDELAPAGQPVPPRGPASAAPDLVCLGEMFCCPYETSQFPKYAEAEGGALWRKLSSLARRHHIYLSAGTIPEKDENGRVFNTAYVFDREGRQIAKHRKMHLFDVDIAGGQYFRESDTLSAGDSITVFDTEFGKMGLAVCFDLRFPELSRLMALDGAGVILVPAAFNATTGPAHWELLFRCRAVDNQCFFVGTSTALDDAASYAAWGHSLVVSPWGDVLSQMDEREGVQLTTIDLAEVQRVRRELPLLSARREDVYTLRRTPPH